MNYLAALLILPAAARTLAAILRLLTMIGCSLRNIYIYIFIISCIIKAKNLNQAKTYYKRSANLSYKTVLV